MVSYNTVGLPIGVFGFLLLLLAASVGIPSLILWYAVAHPSGKVSVAVTVAIALILGCGIVLNWAPWQGLKTYFTAEIVGIVAVSTYDHDAGVTHVQLEDGRLLDLQNPDRTTIDPGRYQTLRGDEWRPGASEGDLLLAGENPSRWFTTASRPWAPDSVCYRMSWTTGIERKDTLDLESGLRLPIAPDLDAWWRGEGPFETGLCLNDQGQVIDMEARY
jgi:hypothetical protein